MQLGSGIAGIVCMLQQHVLCPSKFVVELGGGSTAVDGSELGGCGSMTVLVCCQRYSESLDGAADTRHALSEALQVVIRLCLLCCNSESVMEARTSWGWTKVISQRGSRAVASISNTCVPEVAKIPRRREGVSCRPRSTIRAT